MESYREIAVDFEEKLAAGDSLAVLLRCNDVMREKLVTTVELLDKVSKHLVDLRQRVEKLEKDKTP